ncbi:DUF397 domain-containing protein [Nocardia sp. GCM10030253]|uniref:DUF397 domain-containing protein n=1 Tax=Nocardia sp. GCM10030253 TaxID=3273404 RepID=UPI0036341E70
MNVDLSGAKWFQGSRSDATTGCVEVVFLDGNHVGLRDSKNPTARLSFTPGEWDAFTGGVQDGEFNRPQA